MNRPTTADAPITVSARRTIKGARNRILAKQAVDAEGHPESPGISYYEPGGVCVHFKADTDDGVHVFLPPKVVARIREHAPAEPRQIADLRQALEDALNAFRECIGPEAWGEFTGTSVHGPGVRNAKVVSAQKVLESDKRAPTAPRTEDIANVLERMLKVQEALMPGVRYISVPNYAELNDAPIEARTLLELLRR